MRLVVGAPLKVKAGTVHTASGTTTLAEKKKPPVRLSPVLLETFNTPRTRFIIYLCLSVFYSRPATNLHFSPVVAVALVYVLASSECRRKQDSGKEIITLSVLFPESSQRRYVNAHGWAMTVDIKNITENVSS